MNTSKNAPKTRTMPKEKTSSVVKNETKKTTTNNDVGKIKINQKKVSKNKTSEETDLTKKNKALISVSKSNNTVLAKKTEISTKSTPNLLSSKRRINVADSPSSSRVKKTQYFPSKNLFSNAMKSMVQTKSDELIKKPKIIDKKSTLSPQNTQKKPTVSKKLVKSPDSSSATDRPRTATLRKGSIVNANIVGPEVPVDVISQSKIKETPPEETYEDDFDSYESDFEAASSESDNKVEINSAASLSTTSSSNEEDIIENNFSTFHKTPSSAGTDSERKLDSGTFELTDFKHRQILRYIEDTVKKEEAILELEHSKAEKCAHYSLTDEGFHDEQNKSLQFINFASAQKKCAQKCINEARKQRGAKLMSMIKLDAMNFTIFDSPSVPYEEFISKFSHGKAMQVSIQTGDDNVEEEIQTDFITSTEKWTQMPIKFSSFQDVDDVGFLSRYRCEFLGCGRVEIASENSSAIKFDEIRLEHFLNQASGVVLQLLAEENYNFTGNLNKNPIKLPFSDGYLQFNTSGNILSGSTVIYIKIHPKNSGKVLTIHSFLDDYYNSVICIWNIVDLETPLNCLKTFGNLICAEFHLETDQYIFGGQSDGAIIAWDLNRKCKNYDVISQAPSFTSSSSIGHCSKIISIQNITHEQQNENNEIISLDEAGLLIFWTANFDSTTDLRYSGKEITLIRTHEINLQEIYDHLSDFICTDCIIHGNHIYISTNYGNILHYTLKGTPCAVKEFYNDSKIDPACLELCAFSASHFLVGYSNGDISIFSNNCKEPLLILQNTENKKKNSSIQIISWSKTRPFLFYTKDDANSVHIWDLQKSDMFPEYSIKFPEEIICLNLSSVANLAEIEEMGYMLISTRTGKLYLYLLNEQYGKINHQIFEKEIKIFSNYLNRL